MNIAPRKKEKKENTELIIRTISSFAIVALIVSSVLAGQLYFQIFMSVICAGIVYEWLSVTNVTRPLVLAICVAMVMYFTNNEYYFRGIVILACTFALMLRKQKMNLTLEIVLLGLIYICISICVLVKIYAKFGFIFVLWIFLCVWATDTGAFFIGKIIGGKKLAPKISPGKTWAGFYGGLLVAELVCTCAGIFLVRTEHLYKIILLTLIMSVFAHIGDLVESLAKRYLQVKDMGQLIPGHGGLADRFDSLLMVSLVLSFFLYNFKAVHF